MANLKQTKIYGGLEVYIGENKASITVDPESFYPNGVMDIGCINFDGITVYNAGSALGIIGDISTNNISAVSLNTGTITASKITGLSTLTFTGNTGSISGLKTLNFDTTGSTSSNSITNVHSIAFDGTGSGISNLHGLTLNSNGVINFETNGLSLNKTSISNLETLSFGSSNTTATLLWDGTSFKFDKDIALSNGKLLMGSGNIEYLPNSGEWAITSSYSNSVLSLKRDNDTNDKKVKLDWDGNELSINKPLSIVKEDDDYTRQSTLTGEKIKNVYQDYEGTSTVTIEEGKILVDEKHLNLVIGKTTAFSDTVKPGDTNTVEKSKSNIAIGDGMASASMGGYNCVFIGSGNSKVYADEYNSVPGIGIGLCPNVAGGIGIGSFVDAGNDSIAIGNNAKVSKTVEPSVETTLYSNSIALGDNTSCSTSNGIAIGSMASCSNSNNLKAIEESNAIAIGTRALCNFPDSIAIGAMASCSIDNENYYHSCIAIGKGAKCELSNGMAIGTGATCTNQHTIAIGDGAKCSAFNSVALGYGAYTDAEKEFALPAGYTTVKQSDTTSSDRNDKIDIEPLKGNYINFINKLEPVTYRFNYRDYYAVENPDPKFVELYGQVEYDKKEHKKQTKAGIRTHVGFIAQDVKKILEETFPGEDKLDIVSIAKVKSPEFNTKAIDDEYKKYSMNYTAMIPVLVKAMQEQQAEIEYLKAEIEKLKK